MIIHILCISVLLILLQWQAQDITMDNRQKKYATCCIILTLIIVLAETGCTLTDNTAAENRIWSILFNAIGFGVSPFIFLIESRFYCAEQTRKNYRIYIPALINLCMVISSPASGWIFFVTKDCTYYRGPLFFVYVSVFAFSILVTMLRKIKSIRNYPHYFRVRIISSTCLMLLGLIVQVAFPKYIVSWLIISIYLVLYYALSCEMGSMIDGLTGLLSRSAFNKITSHFKAQKNRRYFLVMIDVNNFKAVNDQQGHPYGDFCLKEIAAVLLSVFKEDASVFRFGGDEFNILMAVSQKETIEGLLEELRAGIAEKQKQHRMFPGIAVGYESFESADDFTEAMIRADSKMYENKLHMQTAAKTE